MTFSLRKYHGLLNCPGLTKNTDEYGTDYIELLHWEASGDIQIFKTFSLFFKCYIYVAFPFDMSFNQMLSENCLILPMKKKKDARILPWGISIWLLFCLFYFKFSGHKRKWICSADEQVSWLLWDWKGNFLSILWGSVFPLIDSIHITD